jgi:hypothetical protein
MIRRQIKRRQQLLRRGNTETDEPLETGDFWWRCICASAIAATTSCSFQPASVEAQVGVTVCSCAPSVYSFILNLTAICNETSVSGLGVERTECISEGTGADANSVTDFVPVAVSNVEIIELDETLLPLSFYSDDGDFRSGDVIEYTSIVDNQIVDESRIPRGLQLNFMGRNSLEQSIGNVVTIVFNNDCGAFPVLQEGDTLGWAIFVSLLMSRCL